VHTDRKPQYLFRKQSTYKWVSMKRSMVSESTEKPLAEKEIYHGKLVSVYAKNKRKHPLKGICEQWTSHVFTESVARAVITEMSAKYPDAPRFAKFLQEQGWEKPPPTEVSTRFARILQEHFQLQIDKSLVKELKKNFPAGEFDVGLASIAHTGGCPDIVARARQFMNKVKWSPTQLSITLRAFLLRRAFAEAAATKAGKEGGLTAATPIVTPAVNTAANINLDTPQLARILQSFHLDHQQLLVVAESLTPPSLDGMPASAPPSMSSNGAGGYVFSGGGFNRISFSALMLQLDAIFVADTGGHRIPLTKTIVTKYRPDRQVQGHGRATNEASANAIAASPASRTSNRLRTVTNFGPDVDLDLPAALQIPGLKHEKSDSPSSHIFHEKQLTPRRRDTEQQPEFVSQQHSSPRNRRQRVPIDSCHQRCLVYYEIVDDFSTNIKALDCALWDMITVKEEDGSPEERARAAANSIAQHGGLSGQVSGEQGERVNFEIRFPPSTPLPESPTERPAEKAAAAAKEVGAEEKPVEKPNAAEADAMVEDADKSEDAKDQGKGQEKPEVEGKQPDDDTPLEPGEADSLIAAAVKQLKMAAGPWCGGNTIEIWLSMPDILKLSRRGFSALALKWPRAAAVPGKGVIGTPATINAVCDFKFTSSASSGGVNGTKPTTLTVPATVLGYAKNSSQFGFQCVVPACPVPEEDASAVAAAKTAKLTGASHGSTPPPVNGGTMLATVSVRALLEGGADAGGGSMSGKKSVQIYDMDIEGGYVYLDKQYAVRAREAMRLSRELQKLRAVQPHRMRAADMATGTQQHEQQRQQLLKQQHQQGQQAGGGTAMTQAAKLAVQHAQQIQLQLQMQHQQLQMQNQQHQHEHQLRIQEQQHIQQQQLLQMAHQTNSFGHSIPQPTATDVAGGAEGASSSGQSESEVCDAAALVAARYLEQLVSRYGLGVSFTPTFEDLKKIVISMRTELANKQPGTHGVPDSPK
jgi:hypothetical protein